MLGFSKEEDVKGQIKEGQYADLSILPDNFFCVSGGEIKRIESVLTVVGGNIVYGTLEFQKLSPPVPKASPDWAPHNYYGGYYNAYNYGCGMYGFLRIKPNRVKLVVIRATADNQNIICIK